MSSSEPAFKTENTSLNKRSSLFKCLPNHVWRGMVRKKQHWFHKKLYDVRKQLTQNQVGSAVYFQNLRPNTKQRAKRTIQNALFNANSLHKQICKKNFLRVTLDSDCALCHDVSAKTNKLKIVRLRAKYSITSIIHILLKL